jgi:hypothetical protein
MFDQNILLIVYPYNGYSDQLLKHDAEIGKKIRQTIDDYRAFGYQICYLFFAKNEVQRLEPNYDKDKVDVNIFYVDEKIDLLWSCGVTAEEFILGKRPDLDVVRQQILYKFPDQYCNLVLGGFHLKDCVEKLYKYLTADVYQDKLLVTIDENLTDQCFNTNDC